MIKFSLAVRKASSVLACGPEVVPMLSTWSYSPTIFRPSRVLLSFDMKTYLLEKKKKQELERLNINDDDDDEMPWIGEGEKQKIDEEEEERRRELAERTKAMLEERAAQEKLKKDKFKQWRAQQIEASKQRKEAMNNHKTRSKDYRYMEEVVDIEKEKVLAENGAFKELEEDNIVQDVDEKRSERNKRALDQKKDNTI
eukprot:Tbor_TRINITY_DN3070_c0_g2::TRINITY_DN3070_c0_g2_i1::g.17352::m.17352